MNRPDERPFVVHIQTPAGVRQRSAPWILHNSDARYEAERAGWLGVRIRHPNYRRFPCLIKQSFPENTFKESVR